MIARAASSPQL
jgi:hypothetical protein